MTIDFRRLTQRGSSHWNHKWLALRLAQVTTHNLDRCKLLKIMEAPPGFEPGMEVLQTSALPLGDGALKAKLNDLRK